MIHTHNVLHQEFRPVDLAVWTLDVETKNMPGLLLSPSVVAAVAFAVVEAQLGAEDLAGVGDGSARSRWSSPSPLSRPSPRCTYLSLPLICSSAAAVALYL